MATVSQLKLWVSVRQVRNSRLLVLLGNVWVCGCSVRHCQLLLFKIAEKLLSSRLRVDVTESCGPRYGSRGRYVQSFPSCFGRKGWVLASAALPPCFRLSHGKEPFIDGSQKPRRLSQRDALGTQGLNRQGLQNRWGHPPALPPESSVQKISCDLGPDRPNLPSFPTATVSDPRVKEPAEETPRWAPSRSPLAGFPQGWGAATWPCVFNSKVMWGMC